MKRNHQFKKLVTVLIAAALGFGLAWLVFAQDEPAPAPVKPVADKSIVNVQGETETVSRTNKQTVFRAWCNIEYSDGTKEHRYLGRFEFVGNLPYNFGFVSDKCDNTNR